MTAEANIIIEIFGVLPALDTEIQGLGAVHLLYAKVILRQNIDKFLAEAAVARQRKHLVIGIQQAAGAKDDLFAAFVIFIVHCHKICLPLLRDFPR